MRRLGGGVIADRDQIRLDLTEVTLDLAEFERAVAEGRPQDAAGLYRGEFLPEEPYAPWVQRPRERTRSSYVGVLRRLADTAAAADDVDGVVTTLHRLLDVDPYDHNAHQT